jgi:hypothetical protein
MLALNPADTKEPAVPRRGRTAAGWFPTRKEWSYAGVHQEGF